MSIDGGADVNTPNMDERVFAYPLHAAIVFRSRSINGTFKPTWAQ